jgi:hypothetical protein
VTANSAVTGQADEGLQPELALAIRCSDMDMRGLMAFVGVKWNRNDPILRTVGIEASYHFAKDLPPISCLTWTDRG